MIFLESWNLDISTSITGKRDYFSNLTLSNYPYQHVVNITTTDIKLIKIMQQGY